MLIAGASLFVATPAHASPPDPDDQHADERVLIRVVPDDEQIHARLRAELGLLGLTPVLLELPSQTPTLGPDLLDKLSDESASAAIEIVIGPNRIDLWVADGNTGKALNRRLDLSLDPEQSDPRTVAIAAVELLRASRLELGESVPRPPDPVTPNPVTPDDSDDPSKQPFTGERPVAAQPTGAISLAPMVGGSPGGFGVTTHIELAGRWAPFDRFALRVSAWIPALGNSVGVTDGRVRMFVGMAFLEPQLLLPNKVKWLHPELGLGLGGAVVGFEGIAREGLRSTTQIVGGFAGYAHAGFGFAVVPRLWIRLDGYVGTVQPQALVKSADQTVQATWGLPFATGSLGLEIWL
jgi:hypothetical protein